MSPSNIRVVLKKPAGVEAMPLEKGMIVLSTAMFVYNFMARSIRAITQELDGFASRYANQIEHVYMDRLPLSEEIRDANEVLANHIATTLK